MSLFDANTLLLVDAVFHGFMALVWLVMAQVFRIAPLAARLLAGAYLSLIPALLCLDCIGGWAAGFSGLPQRLAGLLGMALMGLGVRRMMRLRLRWLDIALIAVGAGVFATALSLAQGARAALAVTSAGMGVLTLLAARDLLTGSRASQPGWILGFLLTPYLLLGLALLSRSAGLLWHGGGATPLLLLQQQAISVGLAWLYLLLTLSIGIGLVGIVMSRLVERIRYMTLRDPLTDTLNRRALAAELQLLQAQVERGQQHSLMMIDVDHFKHINDSLGHAAGDAALLHLVKVLRANMRDLDHLGRMGGEEFCVLLPHTPLAQAGRVAQRMCDALRRQPPVWLGQPLKLSASFGVAACLAGDPQGDASLALADWLVYRAKSQGRDRVCVAESGLRAGRSGAGT